MIKDREFCNWTAIAGTEKFSEVRTGEQHIRHVEKEMG